MEWPQSPFQSAKDRAENNSRLSLRESWGERIFRGAKGDTKKPLDPKPVSRFLSVNEPIQR